MKREWNKIKYDKKIAQGAECNRIQPMLNRPKYDKIESRKIKIDHNAIELN